MSQPRSSQSFFTRPITVIVLLCLTATAWGWNWWHQSRSAPARAHIEAGMTYLEQGQGRDAEREWKAAVRLAPDSVEAWELLGDYYLAAGDARAARAALNRVLELRPATPEIHYRLATANARLEDIAATEQHAQDELKRNPDHVGALDILVTVLARRGEDKIRLQHLRHLVELKPEDDRYVAQLADALIIKKEFEQARPIVEKLLKLKPDFGAAYSMRGAIILHTNPSPQALGLAIEDFKKALSQAPDDVVARLYLGKAYLRLRQPKEAIFHLTKLERLPTAHVSYLFELAKAYQILGNHQKASEIRHRYTIIEQRSAQIDRLKLRISNNPDDLEATLNIGLLLLESEKPIGADKYIAKAIQMRPADPKAKNAAQKLESLYVLHLKSALDALKRRDDDQVGRHLSRVMMLRPYDPRTANALQQFQKASSSSTLAGDQPQTNKTE